MISVRVKFMVMLRAMFSVYIWVTLGLELGLSVRRIRVIIMFTVIVRV